MAYNLNTKEHIFKNGCERVTSDYGDRTFTYNGKTYSGFHSGLDLVSSRYGTDYVVAFADGVVTATRNTIPGYTESQASGNYVFIDHGNGWSTRYYHLKKGSVSVNVGDHVTKGQVIAYMGSTGFSTGCHTHFEVRKNGTTQSPKEFIEGTRVMDTSVAPTPAPSTGTTYNVGDKVRFSGVLYRDSFGNGAGASRSNLEATIYLVAPGRACPYNINEGLGWVRAQDLTPISSPAPTARYYTVVSGDTLWGIAKRFYGNGNRYPEIASANNIANPNIIYIGQKLLIP